MLLESFGSIQLYGDLKFGCTLAFGWPFDIDCFNLTEIFHLAYFLFSGLLFSGW